MRKNVIASLVFGFCLLFVMQTAIAADITKPKDIMKITTAIQKLQAKGYKNIHEIKFKNGFYEAEVETMDGVELNVRVNTKTGDIELPQKPVKHLTMLEVIKKLDAAGYRNISKITMDDDEYEVAAVDKNGKDVELEVNASTGEIKKAWL